MSLLGGGPTQRFTTYCGLSWGPPILGNYRLGVCSIVGLIGGGGVHKSRAHGSRLDAAGFGRV